MLCAFSPKQAQIRVAPYPKAQCLNCGNWLKQRFPESRAPDKGSYRPPGRSRASSSGCWGAADLLRDCSGVRCVPRLQGNVGITNPDPRQFPPKPGMIFDTGWLPISAEKSAEGPEEGRVWSAPAKKGRSDQSAAAQSFPAGRVAVWAFIPNKRQEASRPIWPRE